MRRPVKLLLIVLPLMAGAALAVGVVNTGDEVSKAPLPSSIVFEDWRAPYMTCLEGVNPHVCIRRLVATATSEGEFGPALAMLQDGISQSPELVGACHGLAHGVGEAVVRAGHDLWEAYSVEWPHCVEGYYHGALWEYARDMDIEVLKREKELLCSPFGPAEAAPTQKCAHLIGHLMLYANDLQVSPSLRDCESFVEGILQLHCADGVLMEAVDQARADTDFEGLDIPKDPAAWRTLFGDEEQFPGNMLQECRNAPQSMRVPCFIGLPNALAVLWEYDFERIGRFCAELPRGIEYEMCFRGISVSGFNHFSWEPELIAGACYSFEHAGNELCIANASEALAEFHGSFDAAARICYVGKDEHRELCLDGVQLGLELNAAYKEARR